MVTALGLQVAVVRPLRLRKDPALVAITLRLFALAAVGIFATLRIAFDG